MSGDRVHPKNYGALLGPSQSSSGAAITSATKDQKTLQDAKNAPTAPPIINAPNTTITPQVEANNPTAGNQVPAVRNDDPTFLQALRMDIKYA